MICFTKKELNESLCLDCEGCNVREMLYTCVAIAVLAVGTVAKKTGLSVTPAMGWNSWNHFACDISEDLIKETADAIVNLGLDKLGYEYVNLDDCWQASERDSSGAIQADIARFPSGMKALGDYIHSKGLKFGIYSSAGFKTCQAYPASLGMEEIDAASYAAWGVDYLKYDNCYTDHGPPQKRYPPMASALEASGRDILYSLCEWGRENPAAWAGDIAHSWRVSGDIKDSWDSIISRANIAAPLWRYAGPDNWNDPDMLEVGNGHCSYDEYKSHFSLWAMLKSPLIIGNDVRAMTKDDETMSIIGNDEVIAVNQDALGFQGRRIWSDMMSEVPSVILTKCAAAVSASQQDDPASQQWKVQEDGTIINPLTMLCLQDNSLNNITDEESQHITLTSCEGATEWSLGQSAGGAIVSSTSLKCLEAATFEFRPLLEGKEVRMGECRGHFDRDVVDLREHQSWTTPHGTMRNLYQV